MYQIIGISEDITYCEICGKTNLKKTVVLNHDGNIIHAGCDCAASLLLGNKKKGKIVQDIGKAISYAEKHIGNYPSLWIAEHINTFWCAAYSTAAGTIYIETQLGSVIVKKEGSYYGILH